MQFFPTLRSKIKLVFQQLFEFKKYVIIFQESPPEISKRSKQPIFKLDLKNLRMNYYVLSVQISFPLTILKYLTIFDKILCERKFRHAWLIATLLFNANRKPLCNFDPHSLLLHTRFSQHIDIRLRCWCCHLRIIYVRNKRKGNNSIKI